MRLLSSSRATEKSSTCFLLLMGRNQPAVCVSTWACLVHVRCEYSYAYIKSANAGRTRVPMSSARRCDLAGCDQAKQGSVRPGTVRPALRPGCDQGATRVRPLLWVTQVGQADRYPAGIQQVPPGATCRPVFDPSCWCDRPIDDRGSNRRFKLEGRDTVSREYLYPTTPRSRRHRDAKARVPSLRILWQSPCRNLTFIQIEKFEGRRVILSSYCSGEQPLHQRPSLPEVEANDNVSL